LRRYTSFRRVVTVSCASSGCLVVQEAFMADAKRFTFPKILYPEWQHQYQAALAEVDRKKLLGQVKAAETAIFNRIQAILPSHAAERQAIEDALANLRVLRRHNLGLPVKAR